MENHSQDLECCPPFDPAKWDDKTFTWEGKRFIRDSVCTFFYMPLNFGNVMKRVDNKIREAGATVPGYLMLSDHVSRWKMNLYVAVDKEIPGSDNTALSGTYYCKVYEGPFSDTGKWCKDFAGNAAPLGFDTKKLLMWYTTCPKCAKKYGKNYVAILSEKK